MESILKPQDFFLKYPLYKKLDLAEVKPIDMLDFIEFNGHLDCYCESCKSNSIFNANIHTHSIVLGNTPANYEIGKKIKEIYNENYINDILLSIDSLYSLKPNIVPPYFYKSKDYEKNFVCSRDNFHKIKFHIRIYDNKLFKIGQFPSTADLLDNQVDKYRTILKEARCEELKKSIILFNHNIGIGSFIYLRRIFESLLEDLHSEKRNEPHWNESLYCNLPIEEKVRFFRKDLPPFMVENAFIYGILSKGIHELSEDECLEYYLPIKKSIELILTQKIRLKEEQQILKDARNQILNINNKLKS